MLFGNSAPRPLNTYPIWKNVVVVLSILCAIIYSLPNFYGEDPALQISGQKGNKVSTEQIEQVKSTLTAANLHFKSVEQQDTGWLLRFDSTDDQLLAQDVVSKSLGERVDVAMNLAPNTPAWLKSLGASPMKRGLDLSGGIHFLMEVDMDTALKKKEEALVENFKTDLRNEGIHYTAVQRGSEGGVVVRLRDEDTRRAASVELKRRNSDVTFTEGVEGEYFVLNAKLSQTALIAARQDAVTQNITILRNRVNQLGVAEPLIQKQGAERIVVQLPGIQDSTKAKEILGATATLQFRMVNEERDVADALKGHVPADSEIITDDAGRPYLIKKQVIVEGEHINGAQAGVDENGMPQVNLNLDSQGGAKMAQSSKINLHKRMASVLIEYKTEYEEKDGKRIPKKARPFAHVINAATIQAILGSQFRITGIGSADEAKNLAILLRSGALIAPIQIVEERTIGPSLGKENIESGFKAAAFGVSAVMIFMLFYYRVFGLIANIAVIVNIGLIVTLLSITGAVLTLPGIAGLVLTVGMAVDANVLVYERIKDEIREGTSIALAIDRGYERALWTMIDAHLTTLIAALALMAVGSGPVKGFAITLSLGIPTTLFTAQMMARCLTNWTYGGRNIKKLWI